MCQTCVDNARAKGMPEQVVQAIEAMFADRSAEPWTPEKTVNLNLDPLTHVRLYLPCDMQRAGLQIINDHPADHAKAQVATASALAMIYRELVASGFGPGADLPNDMTPGRSTLPEWTRASIRCFAPQFECRVTIQKATKEGPSFLEIVNLNPTSVARVVGNHSLQTVAGLLGAHGFALPIFDEHQEVAAHA